MKAAMKKAGEISAKEGSITTATDDEDSWKKEFAAFKPASRQTSKWINLFLFSDTTKFKQPTFLGNKKAKTQSKEVNQCEI